MTHLNREYLEDLEWLKEAAEELLDEYLAGELGKPCRVLLEEDAVCRDECYTDCAARRLQTVLKKLEKDKKKPERCQVFEKPANDAPGRCENNREACQRDDAWIKGVTIKAPGWGCAVAMTHCNDKGK